MLYNNLKTSVQWELNIDLKGDILFILTGTNNLDMTDKYNNFIKYSLCGLSDDNIWGIESKDFIIHSIKEFPEKNIYHYFVSCNTLQLKNLNLYQNGTFSFIKSYITNFDFVGSELSNYTNGYYSLDKFTTKINGKNLIFRLNFNVQEVR